MAFSSVETLRPMKPVSPASAPASKRRVASSVKDRTVVVFDWDDTLCPSSWLHAQDLLPKFRGQQINVTPEQREVLSLIGAHVARLLQKAVAYGPVFVVTAAEYGWVEMSAALYLPAVQSILALADVHIVSARSWYEQNFGLGGDSATWKQEVMQLIARKCFAAAETGVNRSYRDPTSPQDAYFNLLSIGDSMAERDACFAAVENVGRTFAKTLKFVEHPNAEEVLQQVELTHDSFEQMCGWDNNLDLRLSRAQLAELRGSPI
ncbi:Protein kinase [Phytophthora megakarya]|uniref:Protein kinase n=1 Tax=Phytophthora megakarya TaxID=4795 RepID=A0A225WQU5_9STRA|nr:Protein kinase [Phytophthora megakarya]